MAQRHVLTVLWYELSSFCAVSGSGRHFVPNQRAANPGPCGRPVAELSTRVDVRKQPGVLLLMVQHSLHQQSESIAESILRVCRIIPPAALLRAIQRPAKRTKTGSQTPASRRHRHPRWFESSVPVLGSVCVIRLFRLLSIPFNPVCFHSLSMFFEGLLLTFSPPVLSNRSEF